MHGHVAHARHGARRGTASYKTEDVLVARLVMLAVRAVHFAGPEQRTAEGKTRRGRAGVREVPGGAMHTLCLCFSLT